MRTGIVSASALAFPLLAPLPSLAQDRPPQGIGFAQAEEGAWLCRHEDPVEALACAQELCAEQSPGQQCVATAWCHPAGWSGVMTIWLPDFHATHALCGAPSEAALEQALAALCAGSESATNCDLWLVVDPDGNERRGEGVSFPGGAAAPAESAGEEAGEAAPEQDEAPPAGETPAATQ
jgi:hypothetical protein